MPKCTSLLYKQRIRIAVSLRKQKFGKNCSLPITEILKNKSEDFFSISFDWEFFPFNMSSLSHLHPVIGSDGCAIKFCFSVFVEFEQFLQIMNVVMCICK